MGKEDGFIERGKYTEDRFKTGKLSGMADTTSQTGHIMMGSGRMICKKGMGKRCHRKVQSSGENTREGTRMDEGYLKWLMETTMKDR